MSTQTKAITGAQSEKLRQGRWLYGPFGGVLLGVGLALAYALIFIVYATIRAALLPARVPPDAGVLGTTIAYGESLAIATLAITVLMAIPAGIIGGTTAFVVTWLLPLVNPRRAPRQAVIVGVSICVAVAAIMHLAFQRALGFTLSDVASNPETYLLWLGFPALIYIAAGGVASWQWNLEQVRRA